MMHTYCLLKDGRRMVVWSDNTQEETMNVYPVKDLLAYHNGLGVVTVTVRYDEIACTDSNRVVAFGDEDNG